MARRTNTAVWHEKHQRWQINVQKDGLRRSFYSSTEGKKGQRECNKKADDWLDGGLINPETRAQKLFDGWLEELKLTTSKGHWSDYQSYWKNWIKKKIGRLKMGDITEQHLQMVINDAYKHGLSHKTLKNIRACMAAFMKYGRKCKSTALIVENVSIPRGAPVGERNILQPDSIRILFSSDKTMFRNKVIVEPLVYAFRFEVVTGLRPGELFGLRWKDIDRSVVSLARSFNRYGDETTGKNDNARRTFVLNALALEILEQQKALGYDSDYVFCRTDGDLLAWEFYAKRWKRYQEHNGITKVTAYEMRHTFVSIVKNLPEGLIKPLVGHSVNMDTYATYGHQVDGEQEQTALMIQDRFNEIIK